MNPFTLLHLGCDQPVADRDDHQRQDETNSDPYQVEHRDGFCHGEGFIAPLVAVVQRIWQLVQVQHQTVQGHDKNVDQPTDDPGVALAAEGFDSQREGDGQAAIDGDAAEDIDANVQVGVVKEASQTTESLAKGPFVVVA